MNPILRILIASAFWGMGGNLNWLFLNFHLEAIGLSKAQIGYANATPAIAAVLFSIPLAFVIPRLGYVRSILIGVGLACGGMLGVASGLAVYLGLMINGLGQGLVMGSVSPLLARLVSSEGRVTIFTWQQALVSGAGFIGGVLGGFLPGWVGREHVLYAVPITAFLSGLVIWGLRESTHTKTTSGPRRFALRNRRNWLLLLIPQTCIGLGAGLTIPFLNLYLQGKFGLSYASVGWLFGITSITAMAALFVQSLLARRLGKVRAIVTIQAASLPFLMILGWAPWLWLVTAAMFVRGALMTAAGPVYTALTMDYLDEEERSGFLLIQGAAWQLVWAFSSAISGRVQQSLGIEGFNYLFAGMLIMYASAVLYYPLFFRPKSLLSSSK